MTPTSTMPHTTPNGTPPKDSWSIAVAEVAATMDVPPYNTPPAKWHKALDLVRTEKVQAHEDGHYTVQGSTRPYSIHGTCPCPQGQSDKSKWCKHLVAVELWKRVQIRLSPTNGQQTP